MLGRPASLLAAVVLFFSYPLRVRTNECSPGCQAGYIGDGVCNFPCFNSDCDWDRPTDGGQSDCQCTALSQTMECSNSITCYGSDGPVSCSCTDPDSVDGWSESWVCVGENSQAGPAECDYMGCQAAWLGDGECDITCNNELCNFDSGDCPLLIPTGPPAVNYTIPWCTSKSPHGLEHNLSSGEKCTLDSAVQVKLGWHLQLKTAFNDVQETAMAVLSGGNASRLFNVYGNLTLVQIIMEHGYVEQYSSSRHGGGCIYVGGLSTLRLIDSVLRQCRCETGSGSAGGGSGGRQRRLHVERRLQPWWERLLAKRVANQDLYVGRARSNARTSAPREYTHPQRQRRLASSQLPQGPTGPRGFTCANMNELTDIENVNDYEQDCSDGSDEAPNEFNDETSMSGGAVYAEGPHARVLFEGNVVMEHNSAHRGGAIALTGGASLYIVIPSAVGKNIDSHAILRGNTAEGGNGGAVLLGAREESISPKCSKCGIICREEYPQCACSDGTTQAISYINDGYNDCGSGEDEGVWDSYEPPAETTKTTSLMLQGNTSRLSLINNSAHLGVEEIGIGGGMSAQGSSVSISLEEGAVLELSDNEGTHGGGIALSSKTATLILRNGSKCIVLGNRASSEGGGIALLDGASLEAQDNHTLLLVEGNTASGGYAGGIGVWSGSSMRISEGTTARVKANVVTAPASAVAADMFIGGAGILIKNEGSTMIVMGSGSLLEVKENRADGCHNGGISLSAGSTMLIQGGASARVVSNRASLGCGGVCLLDADLMRKTNLPEDDTGTGLAGGNIFSPTYIDSPRAAVTVRDYGTHIEIRDNHAESGEGGGIYVRAGIITVEDSAVVTLSGNEASLDGGGIFLDSGFRYEFQYTTDDWITYSLEKQDSLFFYTPSSLIIQYGSTVNLLANIAKTGNGGGISALMSDVMVSHESDLNAVGNVAGNHGGAIFLISGALEDDVISKRKIKGSLSVSTTSTAHVSENIAVEGGGGGLALGKGAVLSVSGSSLFSGNAARNGAGGAIGFVRSPASLTGVIGSEACVSVILIMALANSDFDKYFGPNAENRRRIKVSTVPASAIQTSDLLQENVAEADRNRGPSFSTFKAQWCVPCSENYDSEKFDSENYDSENYELRILMGTNNQPFFGGRNAQTRILLANHPDVILAEIGVWSGVTTLSLPCWAQGALFDGQAHHFTNNTAIRGGALGMSELSENAFFDIKGASFVNNTASGSAGVESRGGAAFASGGQGVGISFAEGCTFTGNLADMGCGGSIAVEEAATLRVVDATALNNIATSAGDNSLTTGMGGFVYAKDSFALLQRVLIRQGAASFGGGAVALSGESAAFDAVTIEGCTAGTGGGGAMLVTKNAELHLLGNCSLGANSARGVGASGGHAKISGGAKLIVHGKGHMLNWPLAPPALPTVSRLGVPASVEVQAVKIFELGEDCSTQNGLWEDIEDAPTCEAAAWALLGEDRIVSAPSDARTHELIQMLKSLNEGECKDMKNPLLVLNNLDQYLPPQDVKSCALAKNPDLESCEILPPAEFWELFNCSTDEFLDSEFASTWETEVLESGCLFETEGNSPEAMQEIQKIISSIVQQLARACPVTCGTCSGRRRRRLEEESTPLSQRRCYLAIGGFPNEGESVLPVMRENVEVRLPVFVSASLLGNCSHATPCICQNAEQTIPVQTSRASGATTFINSTSSASGGAISCAEATSLSTTSPSTESNVPATVVQRKASHNNAEAACQNLGEAVDESTSIYAWAYFDNMGTSDWTALVSELRQQKNQRACFAPGIHLGSGTSILGSVALGTGRESGGGGAINAASRCDVSLEGVRLKDNNASGAGADGGAVRIGTNSRLAIRGQMHFLNNRATGGSGGAVACDGCGNMDGFDSPQVVFLGNSGANPGMPPQCPRPVNSLFIDDAIVTAACVCEEAFYASDYGKELLCMPCPTRSTSPVGSDSMDDCVCFFGTFLTASKECRECPMNSQRVKTEGSVEQACACNENYFGEFVVANQSASSTSETSMSCVRCAQDKTAQPGSIQCSCKKGEYYTLPVMDDREVLSSSCGVCPKGAVCPVEGSTLADMYAQNGYWQSMNHTADAYISCRQAYSDVKMGDIAAARCCAPDQKCHVVPRPSNWTTDSQCAPGYAGILCASCAIHHVMYQGECVPCSGGSPLIVGVGGVCVVGVLVFLITLILLCKTTKAASNVEETRMDRISGILSIIVSWLQVLSALTVTYNFAWPPDFAAYSKGTGTVVNLDFMLVFAVANCQFSVPFINRFLLQALTPIVLILSVVAALVVSRIFCIPKGSPTDVRHTREVRSNRAQQIAILLMNLIYPKLAMRTFEMFRCVSIPGIDDMLLQADMSKKCYQGVHMDYVPLAAIFVVAFNVGFPVVCFFVLWCHRGKLRDPMVKEKYGDLYRNYESGWYYWETFLMVQKCMLTGAMVAIAPGSPLQLLIAMGVCQIYVIMVVYARPYKGEAEDTLSFLVSMALTISLLLGYVIVTDDDPDPELRHFNPTTLGAILILVNVVPFVFMLYCFFLVIRYGALHGYRTEGILNQADLRKKQLWRREWEQEMKASDRATRKVKMNVLAHKGGRINTGAAKMVPTTNTSVPSTKVIPTTKVNPTTAVIPTGVAPTTGKSTGMVLSNKAKAATPLTSAGIKSWSTESTTNASVPSPRIDR